MELQNSFIRQRFILHSVVVIPLQLVIFTQFWAKNESVVFLDRGRETYTAGTVNIMPLLARNPS